MGSNSLMIQLWTKPKPSKSVLGAVADCGGGAKNCEERLTVMPDL
jgi:hypothetical protein